MALETGKGNLEYNFPTRVGFLSLTFPSGNRETRALGIMMSSLMTSMVGLCSDLGFHIPIPYIIWSNGFPANAFSGIALMLLLWKPLSSKKTPGWLRIRTQKYCLNIECLKLAFSQHKIYYMDSVWIFTVVHCICEDVARSCHHLCFPSCCLHTCCKTDTCPWLPYFIS